MQNDNAVDENFSIVANVVVAGTYYVEVRGWCGSGGCETGSYVLNASLEMSASDDHGNTRQTATRIGLSSSTAGVLETDGDVDYFRLEVPRPLGLARSRSPRRVTRTRSVPSICSTARG